MKKKKKTSFFLLIFSFFFISSGNSLQLKNFDDPIPFVWLRDHCRCNSCRHKSTGQRVFDTALVRILFFVLSTFT